MHQYVTHRWEVLVESLLYVLDGVHTQLNAVDTFVRQARVEESTSRPQGPHTT